MYAAIQSGSPGTVVVACVSAWRRTTDDDGERRLRVAAASFATLPVPLEAAGGSVDGLRVTDAWVELDGRAAGRRRVALLNREQAHGLVYAAAARVRARDA